MTNEIENENDRQQEILARCMERATQELSDKDIPPVVVETVYPIETNKGTIIAADVRLNPPDCPIVIRGCRIMDSKDSAPWVSMPRSISETGEWRDAIVLPQKWRQATTNAVLVFLEDAPSTSSEQD